jgi:hypothetical protein
MQDGVLMYHADGGSVWQELFDVLGLDHMRLLRPLCYRRSRNDHPHGVESPHLRAR